MPGSPDCALEHVPLHLRGLPDLPVGEGLCTIHEKLLTAYIRFSGNVSYSLKPHCACAANRVTN